MQQLLGRPQAALGLTAGGLAVVLIWGVLRLQVGHGQDLLRYPRAERAAPARLRIEYSPSFHLTQRAAYHTADDLARVYGWYARFLNPEQHEPPAADSGCLALTRLSGYLFLRHALAVHLCAQPGGTLIIVQRSLSPRLP
jgi:hypothetical protein